MYCVNEIMLCDVVCVVLIDMICYVVELMQCFDIGVLFVCDGIEFVVIVIDCDFVVWVLLYGYLFDMLVQVVVF